MSAVKKKCIIQYTPQYGKKEMEAECVSIRYGQNGSYVVVKQQ